MTSLAIRSRAPRTASIAVLPRLTRQAPASIARRIPVASLDISGDRDVNGLDDRPDFLEHPGPSDRFPVEEAACVGDAAACRAERGKSGVLEHACTRGVPGIGQ
jgi:hypothetical protein